MKHIPYYLLALSLFILSGCIEEFEADIPEADSSLLVVEGTICSGKMNTFILSRTQPVNSSYTPQTVVGAKVSVRGSDGSEYRAEEAGGYYACWIESLNPDAEYSLHIETDGEVYESEPQKPLRTENIAEVRGVQDTPDSDIDILITPDAPFESGHANYYSWTYDETWEVQSNYTTSVFYDIELMDAVIKPNQFPWRGWKDAASSAIMVGGSANYEGQHIQNLKLYDIGHHLDERMYHRYTSLVHQRAITKAEYEYELARRQAGLEMGGLFTPQPSALPTNIHCLTANRHVIGFVGCSMNTSEYRFFLDASDYAIRLPVHDDTREWLKNPEPWLCRQMVESGMFLCEWSISGVTGALETAWTTEQQLDVRYKGAYIEKPDFWIEKSNEE